MDDAMRRLSDGKEQFDAGGQLAARGKVNPSLLEHWIEGELYFRLPPPKKVAARHGAALFRIGIVLVMLLSIAVAYWSFFRHLLPLQKQSRSILR